MNKILILYCGESQQSHCVGAGASPSLTVVQHHCCSILRGVHWRRLVKKYWGGQTKILGLGVAITDESVGVSLLMVEHVPELPLKVHA